MTDGFFGNFKSLLGGFPFERTSAHSFIHTLEAVTGSVNLPGGYSSPPSRSRSQAFTCFEPIRKAGSSPSRHQRATAVTISHLSAGDAGRHLGGSRTAFKRSLSPGTDCFHSTSCATLARV